jgi:hypothetical protein
MAPALKLGVFIVPDATNGAPTVEQIIEADRCDLRFSTLLVTVPPDDPLAFVRPARVRAPTRRGHSTWSTRAAPLTPEPRVRATAGIGKSDSATARNVPSVPRSRGPTPARHRLIAASRGVNAPLTAPARIRAPDARVAALRDEWGPGASRTELHSRPARKPEAGLVWRGADRCDASAMAANG